MTMFSVRVQTIFVSGGVRVDLFVGEGGRPCMDVRCSRQDPMRVTFNERGEVLRMRKLTAEQGLTTPS
jgi:hypothetical protein